MKELRLTINVIPIEEVLLRLSTRDLHAAKFVSREWHSLISDRSFIRLRLKKMETVSGFFFQERYQWRDDDIDRISYIPAETKNTVVNSTVLSFLPENVVILSSCNGLMCCRSMFPASTEPVIYICNPLNKEWTRVKWDDASRETSIGLVFDPFQFPLGDAPTNVQLVAVSETKDETDAETEECEFLFDVYSSGTGKWRRSREICLCKHSLFKNNGIFVDGSLYWLTKGDEILMFDPNLELPYLIPTPLPTTEFQSFPEMCIGESQAKLHYVLLSEYGLHLWSLEDRFASQWDPRCSVRLDELERDNPEVLYNVAEKLASGVIANIAWLNLLAFKDDILFLRVYTDVYTYRFETKKLKRLSNLSELGPISLYSPIVVPYTMSVVPL